jgi:hypothetical protein
MQFWGNSNVGCVSEARNAPPRLNVDVGWALPATIPGTCYRLLAGNAHLIFNRAYSNLNFESLNSLPRPIGQLPDVNK